MSLAHQPTVPDLVRERALAQPAALAVSGPDLELTYGELEGWASAIALELRAAGVGRDVVVGALLPRSARLAAGALGILRAGGAYLPIDPDHPEERAAHMLRDAGCAAVITTPELAGRIAGGPWHVTVLEPAPQRSAAEPAPPAPIALDDVAYVIYTSGSTGHPKGVEVSHGSLLNLCRWHGHAFGVSASDRATQIASPAFDAAVWELWPHLVAGASVHSPEEDTRRDSARLREWLLASGITICFLPTALAEIAMTQEWPAGAALRALLTGADTLRRHPPRGLPFTVFNNYGPTECAVVTTSGRVPHAGTEDGMPSIGSPISNATAQILDGDLRPVPPGSTGELCIGGAGVARGYRGRPDLTAERFVPDPRGHGARLYRTGDLAALRADGEIAFVGRRDAQVKVRGFRVEPGEVAAALARHPAVQSAVVTAWEPAGRDLRLAAYMVPAPGAAPAAAGLRSFLEVSLPSHMIPAAFVHLDALPLTPNGKVDQAALPPPDLGMEQRPREAAPPRTPVEQRTAGIVAELLGLDLVGVDEDFFLLGGHSLLGAQLITRVRDLYGVELSLQSLFDNPTVESMSVEIERLLVERLQAMSDEEVERLLA